MSPILLYLLLLKAALLSFSGLSSLPTVRNDLVVHHRVLSDRQLNTAVAVARMSPGPFGLYFVSAGYYAGGWPGAAAGCAAMVTPAFLILFLLRYIGARASDPRALRAIRWVTCAAAGLIVSSLAPMARDAITGPVPLLIALVTAVVLLTSRVDSAWTIAAGAGAGVLLLSAAGCQSETGRHRPERPAWTPLPQAQNRTPAAEAVTLVEMDPAGRVTGRAVVAKVVLSDDEWRGRLSPLGFAVTRRKATEVAFTGVYDKHFEPGLYRCVACRAALFHSSAKFDSRTGWPSFSAPAAPENVYASPDTSLGEAREEVLCRRCDAHLGHLFPDGPPPTGARYCMNSAALEFQPAGATYSTSPEYK